MDTAVAGRPCTAVALTRTTALTSYMLGGRCLADKASGLCPTLHLSRQRDSTTITPDVIVTHTTLRCRLWTELRPLPCFSQRYKFIIRPEANWDGVAYCCSFDTQPGQWQTIRLPFKDFFPVFRARRMAPGSAQPLDPASISSIQVGDFDSISFNVE